MDYKGHDSVEELSALLKDESPRCLVIVSAAFFDETLGVLLGDTRERSFHAKIEDAREFALLTLNEHRDLHELRQLRNSFAHDLRARSFDATTIQRIERLETWKTASAQIRQYLALFPTAQERLLYVVGIIAFRLQHRTRATTRTGALDEPPLTDIGSWPPVT